MQAKQGKKIETSASRKFHRLLFRVVLVWGCVSWLGGNVGCGKPVESRSIDPPQTQKRAVGKLVGADLAFPTIPIHVATRQDFTLMNKGDAALQIESVTIEGQHAEQFQFVNLLDLPKELLPGEDQKWTLPIEFSAPEMGRYRAQVKVVFWEGKSEKRATFALSGDAKKTDTPGTLRLSREGNIDLGTITNRGDDESVEEVKLINLTQQPITISKLELKQSGEKKVFGFAMDLFFPFRVMPGEENAKSILIRARSVNVGSYQADLVVSSSDAANVPVSGKKMLSFRVKVVEYKEPGRLRRVNHRAVQLRWVGVPKGETQSKEFQFENTGQLPVKVSEWGWLDSARDEFRFKDAPKAPFEIKPKEKKTFIVTFTSRGGFNIRNTLYFKYAGDREQQEENFMRISVMHEVPNPILRVGCMHMRVFVAGVNQRSAFSCNLRNSGNTDLTVENATLEHVAGSKDVFSLASRDRLVIGPNRLANFIVYYQPTELNLEDVVKLTFKTNMRLREGEEAPFGMLYGQVRCALLWVSATQRNCSENNDCAGEGEGFTCRAAPLQSNRICRRSEETNAVVRFAKTKQGESNEQYLRLQSLGRSPVRISEFQLVDPSGTIELKYDKSRILNRNLYGAYNLVFVYKAKSATPPTDEIYLVVKNNSCNAPEERVGVEFATK